MIDHKQKETCVIVSFFGEDAFHGFEATATENYFINIFKILMCHDDGSYK
jgi:hypothetical protein